MALFQNLTIREIGERAGVSIATVSRALNGTGPVSEPTMHKIRSAMEALGYQAPAASKQPSKRVILASFPDMVNPFNADMIKGITDAASRYGYRVVFYVNENYSIDAGYEFLEQAEPCDGLILAHTLPDQQRLVQLAMKKPVVMCSEHISGCIVPYVAIDDYAAACTAVEYLISSGRKKIACVNSSLNNNYAIHRERGYRACLEKAGLPVREDWVLHLPSVDFSAALGSMGALMAGEERPDAVFCVSDVFAASVIRYCTAHGIRVPQDVSVIGFDDIPLATMVTPTISTVRQPTYQMGLQACNILIQQIENPQQPPAKSAIILNTDLIIRASTNAL